jgi:hypothetical protein
VTVKTATPDNPPLPFALQIIMSFLVLDSLDRIYDAVHLLVYETGDSWRAAVFGLWVATNVLLLLLLLLRTFAGRLWTLVVFGIHMFYIGYHLIATDKLLWLSLNEWGQTRIFVTLAIDAWIMHLISRDDVKDYLIE